MIVNFWLMGLPARRPDIAPDHPPFLWPDRLFRPVRSAKSRRKKHFGRCRPLGCPRPPLWSRHMIPRYTRPEMASIWEPQTRFKIWFEIEAHAADALAELGTIPK